ncbi:MAG: TIR domain-containing protein [Blastocatellia bacterium]
MKDFFISYNKADRDIALWIARQLQSHGYSAIIQAEDMPPGSNFVREMDKACKEAAQILLVLSPDYLKSEYTQPEWHAFFRKDPTGDKRLLIPVRVRDCKLDGLLAQIVYIDLAGKDGAAATEVLLAGIELSRTQSQLPVRFPVDELIDRYCNHLAEKVSRVRIFGDEQSHPLDQVFVELTINEDYDRRPNQAEFLGLMDAELRKMRSVFGDPDERRDRAEPGEFDREIAIPKRTIKPDELLRRRTHAVITGAPGCGKTTLLRYLAWQTLKTFVVPPSGGSSGAAAPRLVNEPLPPEGGTTNTARFPVFLELKQLTTADFQQAQGQLEDLLFNKAIAATTKPRDEAERDAIKGRFQDLLREGRVAIFLDGLDEVSGTGFFKDLQTAVQEFLQSAYRDNTVIISTRPFALSRFADAKEMEILPLNQRQIEQFIEHYHRDAPERQQFQRELQRRRELRELARVPALLGFILQLWRKRGSVTDDKLELYAQITLELAQQLDREKEGIAPEREWLVEDKDGSLKLDFLRQLAFNQLFKGLIHPPYEIGGNTNDVTRLVFTSEQLRAEAAAFARTLKEREGITINPRNLAEDVKATALLRQVGADHYAFAHLTLQEYLAAWQLAKRDNGDTCERIFCRAYFNPTLAEMEVLPMTLGLVDEPDKFYEALEQLPEAFDFRGLRLRARGLSYPKISEQVVAPLVEQLVSFLFSDGIQKTHFRDAVYKAFMSAGGRAKELIENRIGLLQHSGDLADRLQVSYVVYRNQNERVAPLNSRYTPMVEEDVNIEAIPGLFIRLRSESSVLQVMGSEQLYALSDAVLAQGLSLSLVHEDSFVRQKAAALISYYSADVQSHEKLAHLVTDDPSEEVRQIASNALPKLERKLQYFDIPIPTTTIQ